MKKLVLMLAVAFSMSFFACSNKQAATEAEAAEAPATEEVAEDAAAACTTTCTCPTDSCPGDSCACGCQTVEVAVVETEAAAPAAE